MKWVGICFGLTHRWRRAKTHTGKRTLTHNVGIHTHILPQRPIILIQLKRLQKKNSSSGENPREEPDKTRTWWEANHLDLSQQRDTFRKLQLGASFLLHMRKKKQSWEFLFECSFLSKYESGVSDGRPALFKPDHYTNNSVYADYRSQFSLSDFLYVAGPIKFSLWLQLKEQKSSPGPWPRSRAACSSQSPQAVSQTQRFITKISCGSAIWVWIYLCGDQLHNTNYSPAVSQLCRDG